MSLDRIINFFTSLRLTVACLCLGLVLVFIGTLGQVDMGLYKAQNEFFRSLFVFWGPQGAGWRIPVFPGGYLLGSVLLLNLIAAHIRRFSLSKKKIGIFMIHAGLILLLLGQLLTDMLSSESAMHLRVGETKCYSEAARRSELAVMDATDPADDTVVSIPEEMLVRQSTLRHPLLPFTIRVENYYPNADISAVQKAGYETNPATQGTGVGLWMREQPRVTSTDFRDIPAALIEVIAPQGSLGKWFVSGALNNQTFNFGKHTYQIALRPSRYYKPFTLKLLEFNHAVYKGTPIPKDFASVVRLERPDSHEAREVRIYMNNPLRYNGETFYQQSFDQDDHGTVLEVVHNPSWLTPYVSVILVGLGMMVQFLSHLVGFIKKRIKT